MTDFSNSYCAYHNREHNKVPIKAEEKNQVRNSQAETDRIYRSLTEKTFSSTKNLNSFASIQSRELTLKLPKLCCQHANGQGAQISCSAS